MNKLLYEAPNRELRLDHLTISTDTDTDTDQYSVNAATATRRLLFSHQDPQATQSTLNHILHQYGRVGCHWYIHGRMCDKVALPTEEHLSISPVQPE